MADILFKDESYKIIGLCLEVHNILGKGHNEIVYKEALEVEFRINKISYSCESQFEIHYKGNILKHKFITDFIVYRNIILEVKAIERIDTSHIKQVLNYLAASKLSLGMVINFGEDSLKYKRVVL